MKKQATYHIIGGGAAGLNCARYIKKYNKAALTVVYEASDKIGGRCYSYDDKELGRRLDNATHVILGANKNAARLIGNQEWEDNCLFWDVKKDTISSDYHNYRSEILKAMCNIEATCIPPKMINKIFWKLFPWGKKQRKIYFSKQDLSQILINPLLAYTDRLFLNTRLMKIETQFGKAAQLNFNNRLVEIGPDDKIILALDARNYQQLMGGESFEFNGIINIFYRTSQKITLPRQTSLLCEASGLADWVFVNDDVVAVTLSAVQAETTDLDDLARRIWKQLDQLRGVNSAFVPAFRVVHHKLATIRQDEVNNNKRPLTAATAYPNLFIAGDWTMKDYPCSLETAILSAERAAKAALKD